MSHAATCAPPALKSPANRVGLPAVSPAVHSRDCTKKPQRVLKNWVLTEHDQTTRLVLFHLVGGLPDMRDEQGGSRLARQPFSPSNTP